ncbi:MAG: hypothetical protein ABWZ52_13840 [Acidimicrobiales bacterium]
MARDDEREAKLPAWARQKLDQMRELTLGARRELEIALLASKPEESEAVINPYGNIELGLGALGLGRRVMVRWRLDDPDGHAGIDVRQTTDGKWLYLASSDGRLTAEWDATNTLRVRRTR